MIKYLGGRGGLCVLIYSEWLEFLEIRMGTKIPQSTSNAYLLGRWFPGGWIHERLDLHRQIFFSIKLYLGRWFSHLWGLRILIHKRAKRCKFLSGGYIA